MASAEAVVPAGQVTLGGVVSLTVNVVLQVELLSATSVAVTVIVCTPRLTDVPAVGLWLRVIVPGQLSVAVAPVSTFGIGAWPVAFAETEVPAGQETVGGVVSLTVNVVLHEALLVAASVPVTVMV